MALLRFDELSFAYPGASRRALDRISFSIEEGEYIALAGPSGSGKTTLLRHAKPGLVPVGAVEGSVYYNDIAMDELPAHIAARQIGFVQQNPDNQIVTDFVWHELAFALENMALPVPVIRRRVAEMAAFFGMEAWFRSKTSELSGGQKQLLNLASALAMNPGLLILDEPTAMLDPLSAESLLSAIRRVNRELGVAVLISEHRLDGVFPWADRVLLMDSGRLVSAGAPGDIATALANKKDSARIYYGLPASVRIFAELGFDKLPLIVRDARREVKALVSDKTVTAADTVKSDKPKGKTVLSAHDIWFRYAQKGRDILRGAAVELEKGELLCLLGGNGAGKSTLLRSLAGTLKPYRGKVKIEKNARLAMLPQNARTLFVADTVKADLLDAADGDEPRAIGMAKKLELEPLLSRHPYDLSGGETQRLAVGKLLLRSADILLLDEPTKGLDAYARDSLAALLRMLVSEGVSILVVTHDVDFAALYADRCALMFDGEIASADEPHAFFAGNSFYTTSANRIAGDVFPQAITVEEVVTQCKKLL